MSLRPAESPRPRRDRDAEKDDKPIRPGVAGTSYFCAECSAWRETLDCQVCGAELDDGITDEGGAGVGIGFSPSFKAWSRALRQEIVPSLPGALVCASLVFFGLTQRLPFSGPDRTWPGQLLATFVCTYWLLERTRASHQRGIDLDMSHVALSMLRALLVLPLMAGVASGHWAGLPVALILAPFAPLLLGALVSDDPRELLPGSLWSAFRATAGYFRLALMTAGTIAVSTMTLWQLPEESSLLRALVATLGATVAGTIVGIARRGAEHVPEDEP